MTVAIKVWNSTAYTGNACTLRFLKIKKKSGIVCAIE